jgi:RNA ligase (TIGR02306 family)
MTLIDEIIDIIPIDCDSFRYDIEVEDNHNFFADSILVHNCQNIPQIIVESYNAGRTFEVTEKLEGSSMTCYILENDDGEFEFGVCSRNIDLKRDDANSFWEVAIRDGIEEKLKTLGQEIAIQGELIGPGVQGNIYGLTKLDFYVYDIYNVEIGEYVKPDQRQKMVSELGLKHVPILDVESKLTLEAQDLLDGANGKSKIGIYPKREGQVWKDTKGGLSFKIISNEYLNSMSEED